MPEVDKYWVCLDAVLAKYSQPISQSGQEQKFETSFSTFPTTDSQKKEPTAIVAFAKPIIRSEERFITLQSWEGIVFEVREEAFVAKLMDKTNGGYDQEAEFSFEEVSPYDHSLIKTGAIFYWDIGYSENKSKQRIRASIIKFRRRPAWTSNELKIARERAKRLTEKLGWGKSEPTSTE